MYVYIYIYIYIYDAELINTTPNPRHKNSRFRSRGAQPLNILWPLPTKTRVREKPSPWENVAQRNLANLAIHNCCVCVRLPPV